MTQSFTAASADVWGLSRVVAQLRSPRTPRLSGRARERLDLPSREVVSSIVDGLRASLFPAHFGPADLTEEGVDYFVGHTLDVVLRSLHDQVRRVLHFGDPRGGPIERRAVDVTRIFAARLPSVRALLETDVRAAFQGDPAARSLDEALFCYPGVTAIIHHRLAHELHLLGVPLLARIVSEIAHADTGIAIHPGASIGSSFFIAHGTGVVIGETSVIGDRVRLYQGVTLGADSFPSEDEKPAEPAVARHPILEDDVVVYAGATLLGPILIGRGSSIGGNVWLTRGVPAGSRVTQAQVRSEVFDAGAGI